MYLLRDIKDADVQNFFSCGPQMVRGKVVEVDGEVAVIGGIFNTDPMFASMDIVPEFSDDRKCQKLYIKACTEMMTFARDNLSELLVAAKDDHTAPTFLKHYGFEEIDPGIYLWTLEKH